NLGTTGNDGFPSAGPFRTGLGWARARWALLHPSAATWPRSSGWRQPGGERCSHELDQAHGRCGEVLGRYPPAEVIEDGAGLTYAAGWRFARRSRLPGWRRDGGVPVPGAGTVEPGLPTFGCGDGTPPSLAPSGVPVPGAGSVEPGLPTLDGTPPS